jgi:hypothetical protein
MADTYKIGVRLAMTSNMPEMLGVLMTKLTGVGVKVDDLKGKFGTLGLAIGGAFGVFSLAGAFSGRDF